MTIQINSNYLEKYTADYAVRVCEKFFSSRQYITGQDIVQLTNSAQVNFFIIKRLFELWQEELDELKSNPYFDYRDIAVHEALTQFMNVLSRRIKVERQSFEPLVDSAVQQAVILATDPVGFYQSEVRKAPAGKINDYLKENKKYYKWHDQVVVFLIDKAGFGHDDSAYLRAIAANYQTIQDSLESVNLLLATLGDIKPFDLDAYFVQEKAPEYSAPSAISSSRDEGENSFFGQVAKEPVAPDIEVQESSHYSAPEPEPVSKPIASHATVAQGKLDPELLKSRFETLSYKGMSGVVGDLGENIAINQRFMFTKELFDGNADLLRHALKSIDGCHSFNEAINLVNARYVDELNWEPQSEPVLEFLQLIYRKFEV